MAIYLYGLKHCQTCRRAGQWLNGAGIPYQFVDFRDYGVPADRLAHWADELGWPAVLNRRSRVWQKMSEDERHALDRPKALALMQDEPTLIKRPVLEADSGLVIGFSAPRYEAALAGAD